MNIIVNSEQGEGRQDWPHHITAPWSACLPSLQCNFFFASYNCSPAFRWITRSMRFKCMKPLCALFFLILASCLKDRQGWMMRGFWKGKNVFTLQMRALGCNHEWCPTSPKGWTPQNYNAWGFLFFFFLFLLKERWSILCILFFQRERKGRPGTEQVMWVVEQEEKKRCSGWDMTKHNGFRGCWRWWATIVLFASPNPGPLCLI